PLSSSVYPVIAANEHLPPSYLSLLFPAVQSQSNPPTSQFPTSAYSDPSEEPFKMSYYNDEPRGSYGQNQPQSYGGPPQVPYPWVAEWDERDRRWIFINRENGERTFEHPQPSYRGDGYGERGYEQGYGRQEQREYGGQEQRGYYEQQPPKPDHHVRNTVLGAAAGVI